MNSINGASEQMTEAVRDSYQAVANSAVASQERGTRLAQDVFESSMQTLKKQADTNRAVMDELVNGMERQQEAYQYMLRESFGTYLDLVNSAFYYSRRGVEAGQAGAQEGVEITQEAARQTTKKAEKAQ
ncbi:MAG: hypothetical protein ACFB50_19340 [Rubrobacteraceae bacterium]